MIKRLLTLATDRIYDLPIVVLMPHSRCNCRCVMCDIWKANHEKRELSVEDLGNHLDAFKRLSVREVVFSGGEALMHSNLWRFCELLRSGGIKITLLTTGLLLQRNAGDVASYCDEVIISLDGSEEIHDRIRNIPKGFTKIGEGIAAIKSINFQFPISARCVLQRYNYFDFEHTVRAARRLGLDKISFLAADVFTSAFNRSTPWNDQRVSEIALSRDEVNHFEKILENAVASLQQDFATGFIVESPGKLNRILQYYRAVNGDGNFPEPVCNAPWVSAVIESDGSVLPCFFHKPYGNIFGGEFSEIINSKEAIEFRKALNVRKDDVCRKCVCSLKLPLNSFTNSVAN